MLITDALEFNFEVLRDTLCLRVIGNSSPFTVRSIEVIGRNDNFVQSFYIAVLLDVEGNKSHLYYSDIDKWINFLLSAASPKEFKNRLLLSSFLDKLILAYNDKNISALKHVYAEDGIVLVGRVIDAPDDSPEFKNKSGVIENQIRYNEQSGTQYIMNLERLFERSSLINVDYKGVEIRLLTRRNNTYAILFDQDWVSKGMEGGKYTDSGTVCLIVELRMKDFVILNRAWGPSADYFTPHFIDKLLSFAE